MTLKGKEYFKNFRGRKSGQDMAGPPTTALKCITSINMQRAVEVNTDCESSATWCQRQTLSNIEITKTLQFYMSIIVNQAAVGYPLCIRINLQNRIICDFLSMKTVTQCTSVTN